MELGLEPVGVSFFVLQQAFEQHAGCVVAGFRRHLDGVVVQRHRADLELQIAGQLLFYVLSYVQA